jgi:hypothetical protein
MATSIETRLNPTEANYIDFHSREAIRVAMTTHTYRRQSILVLGIPSEEVESFSIPDAWGQQMKFKRPAK